MGTPITPEIQVMYEEDTGAGGSVSEEFAGKVAANIMAIQTKCVVKLDFGPIGSYYNTSMPLVVGTSEIVPFDYKIANCFVTNEISGTSGTTEVDIEKLPLSGGSWTSIFSTTPKFDHTSSDLAFIDTGALVASGTGITKPVLASQNLDAGDRLRFKLKQAMVGGSSVILNLFLLPR